MKNERFRVHMAPFDKMMIDFKRFRRPQHDSDLLKAENQRKKIFDTVHKYHAFHGQENFCDTDLAKIFRRQRRKARSRKTFARARQDLHKIWLENKQGGLLDMEYLQILCYTTKTNNSSSAMFCS